MMDRIEPEREMIRRVLPFGPPAVLLAFLVGAGVSSPEAGLSAGIGVVVVLLNLVVHGRSLAWAARISLTVLYTVALGGFILRLAAIVAIMFALDRVAFFSALAFVLAVIPATFLLLAFEMRQLQGRMQVELWNFSPREPARR
jgi:ATP synthase protein I